MSRSRAQRARRILGPVTTIDRLATVRAELARVARPRRHTLQTALRAEDVALRATCLRRAALHAPGSACGLAELLKEKT